MRQRFGCRSQRAEPSSPTGLVPASRSKRPPSNGLVNRKAASKIGRGFFVDLASRPLAALYEAPRDQQPLLSRVLAPAPGSAARIRSGATLAEPPFKLPRRGFHPVGWDQSARSAFQTNKPNRGAGPPSSYVSAPPGGLPPRSSPLNPNTTRADLSHPTSFLNPVGWDQSARSAFQANKPSRGAGPPSSYVRPPLPFGCSPQPTHPLSRVLAPAPGSAARTLSGAILPEPPFKIPHRGLGPDPVPAPKHPEIEA